MIPPTRATTLLTISSRCRTMPPRTIPRPALYPAFFFILEKAVKGAGNAVISTLLMHRSYGLQHLRHKRLTFASADKSGYTHSAFGERSHTAAHTVKQGCFGWGWYHYSRSVPHVHQHPRAGYQNGKFYRFWGLVGGAPKERRKSSEQRCAYARRCSEASRPRWAA